MPYFSIIQTLFSEKERQFVIFSNILEKREIAANSESSFSFIANSRFFSEIANHCSF